MVCNQCGTNVEDNCLICPNCQSSVAFLNQKEVVTKIQDNTRNDIAKVFKSKSFLIFAIGMTCVFITHIAFMLPLAIDSSGLTALNIILLLICAGCTIPPLLSAITSWKLFTHKKGGLEATQIQGLKKFPAFWQVIFSIFKVLVIIVEILIGAIICFFLYLQLGARADLNSSQESSGSDTSLFGSSLGIADKALDFTGGVIVFLIVIFVLIIIFFHYFFKLGKSTYADINNSFDKISKAYISGQVNKASAIKKLKFYTLACMFILLSGSLFTGGSLDIDAFLGFGGMMLSNGIYLILCTIFFNHADTIQKNHDILLQEANAKLLEINKSTIALKNERMRQAREAQYKLEQEQLALEEARSREQRKRDLEKERSREMTQELLMQQMMLMMQQNMKNSSFLNPTDSIVNAESSSPENDSKDNKQ